MAIDPMRDAPLWRQLADHLRDRITDGDLPPGAPLPSRAELQDEHGVSSTVVHKALDTLRSEGLLWSASGRGVFVRTKPPVRLVSSERYRAMLDALHAGKQLDESALTRDLGVPWSDFSVDCEFAEVTADPDVAEALSVPKGEPVFERRIVMRVRGEAQRIVTAWYPLPLVAGTGMTDVSRQPVPGGVIAELDEIGVTVTWFTEEVWTRMPTPDESVTLRLRPGVPVLCVTRIGFSGERPIEYTEHMWPGDRAHMKYEISLGTVDPPERMKTGRRTPSPRWSRNPSTLTG